MITIKDVKTLAGEVVTHTIPSEEWIEIEAEGKLLLLPGVIDPNICLGPIGTNQWNSAIHSLIRGGVTTIIDIPHEFNAHTKKNLEEKSLRAKQYLNEIKIPLNFDHYLLYSDLQREKLDIFTLKKSLIKGVVINLDQHESDMSERGWENLFRLAAQEDIPIVLNSSNGDLEKKSEKLSIKLSLIEKAIKFTEDWSNRLYVLNVSNQREIDLIQEGRERSLLIFAETNAQHLFSDNHSDTSALWEALNHNVIETIGSGFDVNHVSNDKIIFKGKDYQLCDPLFLLPMLLTAIEENKLIIDQLIQLTSFNVEEILELNKVQNFILVDLEKRETIRKIRRDQIVDHTLIGWPVYSIVNGRIFSSSP